MVCCLPHAPVHLCLEPSWIFSLLPDFSPCFLHQIWSPSLRRAEFSGSVLLSTEICHGFLLGFSFPIILKVSQCECCPRAYIKTPRINGFSLYFTVYPVWHTCMCVRVCTNSNDIFMCLFEIIRIHAFVVLLLKMDFFSSHSVSWYGLPPSTPSSSSPPPFPSTSTLFLSLIGKQTCFQVIIVKKMIKGKAKTSRLK